MSNEEIKCPLCFSALIQSINFVEWCSSPDKTHSFAFDLYNKSFCLTVILPNGTTAQVTKNFIIINKEVINTIKSNIDSSYNNLLRVLKLKALL